MICFTIPVFVRKTYNRCFQRLDIPLRRAYFNVFPEERIPPADTSIEDFYRVPEKRSGADAMAGIDDPLATRFADLEAGV